MACNQFTTWQTPKGGDFRLKTPDAELNTADLRGKTLFIFFGFLHCPHVCPTTIRELNRMARALSPEERKKVAFIFVTVDPERDTPQFLKEHFASMDPSFIPATGTEEEIRNALGKFGGDFKVTKGKDPEDIFIDHTSNVFVINRKGVWVNSLPYDTSAQDFTNALAVSRSQLPYWSDEAQAGRINVLGGNEECDLGKESCSFTAPDGGVYELALTPRPVKHLEKIRLTVKSKNNHRLTPKLADLVGLQIAMGLLRPKLVKTHDRTWVANFTLPTCELKNMNWKLRLLLQDNRNENFEMKFGFSSINDK